MRIAIFSDHFHPELGGIQDAVDCLARGLAARGHEIDIYVPRYSPKEYRRAGAPLREPDLGPSISIHRQASIPYRSSSLQTRVILPSYTPISLMKHRRPDIIHSHTVFGLGLAALAAARFWAVPLVATYHMAMAVNATYIPANLLKNFTAYVRWYLNQCDFVSAPAGFVFDELGKNLRPRHEVISNSIDLDLFSAPRPGPSTNAHKRPTLIYAGKFAQEKRVDLLVAGLQKIRETIPEATLSLAGHGDQQGKLNELAQALNIKDSIHFTGTLDKKQLAHAYQASDIFVSMSSSEVQSVSQMQAMACGLPVVCARREDGTDSASPADQGIIAVAPNAVDDFANAIKRLVAKPAMRSEMSRLATSAMQPYSISSISAQWEQQYVEVAERA